MKKRICAIFILMILLCIIMAGCDYNMDTSNNNMQTKSTVAYEVVDGKLYKHVSDLTAYIRELARQKEYADVALEMELLGISEEEYLNSESISFGGKTVITTEKLYDDLENNSDYGAVSQSEIESNTTMLSVPSGATVIGSISQREGNGIDIFAVSFMVLFTDMQPSSYIDLIEIICDPDLFKVAEEESTDYEGNNALIINYTNASGESVSVTSNEMNYNIKNKSVTFPFDGSNYDNINHIIAKCEFSGPDSTFLNGEYPSYYAFTLSYAKAQKSISLDSIGFSFDVSAGEGGLSAFPGVSFSFSQKESFDTWSTTIGTWAYDGTYPVTEGAVYRIKSNKNTGLLGLLNRWMQVSKTSTEAGTTINTDSGTFKTGQYFTFVPHIDGTVLTYEILPNHIMGYCISSANGQVTMQPRDDSNAQRFRIEESGSSYVIKTYDGTKCLGFNDDDVVQLETYTGASDQLWTFRYEYDANSPMEYAEYVLSNVGSDLYMDVSESSTANGAGLIQYERRAEPNQKFMLVYVGDGEYSLIPVMATSKRVTVDTSNSNGEGAAVYLWDANGSDNQRFKLVRGNNGFKLLTASSGFTKALGVVEDAMDGGVAIQQLTSTSSFIYWKFA